MTGERRGWRGLQFSKNDWGHKHCAAVITSQLTKQLLCSHGALRHLLGSWLLCADRLGEKKAGWCCGCCKPSASYMAASCIWTRVLRWCAARCNEGNALLLICLLIVWPASQWQASSQCPSGGNSQTDSSKPLGPAQFRYGDSGASVEGPSPATCQVQPVKTVSPLRLWSTPARSLSTMRSIMHCLMAATPPGRERKNPTLKNAPPPPLC